MSSKGDLSRITIDIKRVDHKRLKALAAVLGKSMRELVSDSIQDLLSDTRCFNEETIKTMEETTKRVDLVSAEDVDDLFEKHDA